MANPRAQDFIEDDTVSIDNSSHDFSTHSTTNLRGTGFILPAGVNSVWHTSQKRLQFELLLNSGP